MAKARLALALIAATTLLPRGPALAADKTGKMVAESRSARWALTILQRLDQTRRRLAEGKTATGPWVHVVKDNWWGRGLARVSHNELLDQAPTPAPAPEKLLQRLAKGKGIFVQPVHQQLGSVRLFIQGQELKERETIRTQRSNHEPTSIKGILDLIEWWQREGRHHMDGTVPDPSRDR